MFDIICLLAILRLLCFLLIHYKNNSDMIKSERNVVLDNIDKVRNTLDVYCKQESVFGVYCKLNMNKINEEYPMLHENTMYATTTTTQNDETFNIENFKNIEKSYYGIYKDNILFA